MRRLKASGRGKVSKLRKKMEKAAERTVIGERSGIRTATEEIPGLAYKSPEVTSR